MGFFLKKFEKVEKTGTISTKFSLRCTPSVILGTNLYFIMFLSTSLITYGLCFWQFGPRTSEHWFFIEINPILGNDMLEIFCKVVCSITGVQHNFFFRFLWNHLVDIYGKRLIKVPIFFEKKLTILFLFSGKPMC